MPTGDRVPRPLADGAGVAPRGHDRARLDQLFRERATRGLDRRVCLAEHGGDVETGVTIAKEIDSAPESTCIIDRRGLHLRGFTVASAPAHRRQGKEVLAPFADPAGPENKRECQFWSSAPKRERAAIS